MPVPKPETGESKEDYLAKCHKFLHDENKARDEKRPDDQISAICYEQWREYAREVGFESEPIPLLRSFESDGKRYVYGYAAIFDSPDFFGTTMTKGVVEDSLPHLRKFPAVRFMHREPFGQIVFDKDVDGIKTFVGENGFHVLCEIYPEAETQWNMVTRGSWGFSYGFMPDVKGGGVDHEGRFVKGVLYEVSVVDSPAHEDAVAYVMRRMIDGHKGGNFVTNERITAEEEKRLSDSSFACIVGSGDNKQRKLPINDAAHCRNAMARYNQAEGCQTAEVKAKICSAARKFGIDNAFEKGGFCYKGVEKSMENKEEMEQWLKDAEKRIFDKVTEAINAKKTTVSMEDSLKAMEERVMKALDAKLAEKKEPSQVEKTFGDVQHKIESLDKKIEKLRGLEKTLKAEGEDNSNLVARITEIEKQRDDLASTIIKSVEDVVERKLGKVDERLAAIENIPDLRSPATTGEKPVRRGMGGFGDMLEASRRGTQ